MTNFDVFMRDPRFARFAESAVSAEHLLHIDAGACILNCRRAMEGAVKWMYSADTSLHPPGDTSLYGLMCGKDFRELVDPAVWQRMDLIRRLGNAAAHDGEPLSVEQAALCLENLFSFLDFAAYCYIKGYTPGVFDKSLLALTAEEALSFVSGTSSGTASPAKESRAQKNALSARRAAQAPTYIPSPLTAVDKKSRKIYLDAMLSDAGWTDGQNRFSDVSFSVGKGQKRRTEKVDRVLYGKDRSVLALVFLTEHSGRTEKERSRALSCAETVRKQSGILPVIYYTDGFDVQADDGVFPERKTAAIPSARDLVRMAAVRSAAASCSALPPPVSSAADRPYQTDAVRALYAELCTHKRRRALLVMASGSGKTRTVFSLCRLLTGRGIAQNILYLADDESLVTQAARSFASLLPDCRAAVLTETPACADAPFLFSTYRTMMTCIDTVRDSTGKVFTCGHFDLVICDEINGAECRQSRDLLTYFDAPMIGMTSAPGDTLDAELTAFFSPDTGKPAFVYPLESALRDGYVVDFLAIVSPHKFLPADGQTEKESKKAAPTPGKAVQKNAPGKNGSPDTQALDAWLFSENGIREMLHILMERGLRVENGRQLGKTVIFAKNESHAKKILRIFRKEYPEKKNYAAVIGSGTPLLQSVVDAFASPDSLPRIAVSSDTLDGGVDIPEILNLVFFKKANDRAHFLRMLGRGARLCPGLLDGADKQRFCIFDFCGNLEAYPVRHSLPGISAGKNGAETADPEDPHTVGDTRALSCAVFRLRAALLCLLWERTPHTRQRTALCESLAAVLYRDTAVQERSGFAVRQHLPAFERFAKPSAFRPLTADDADVLCRELAPLVSPAEEDDDPTLSFDALLCALELAALAESASPKADPGSASDGKMSFSDAAAACAQHSGQWRASLAALLSAADTPSVRRTSAQTKRLRTFLSEEQERQSVSFRTPEALEQLRTALRPLIGQLPPDTLPHAVTAEIVRLSLSLSK